MVSLTTTYPEVEEETDLGTVAVLDPLYDVIVLDTPVNTYEECTLVLVEALACSMDQAYLFAVEIDTTGSACVATVERPEARRIAAVIRRIGIEVRVETAA